MQSSTIFKQTIFELMLSRSQDNYVTITCNELIAITGFTRHYCLKAVLELEVQHGKIRRTGINSTTYKILDRSLELLDIPKKPVQPKKLFTKKHFKVNVIGGVSLLNQKFETDECFSCDKHVSKISKTIDHALKTRKIVPITKKEAVRTIEQKYKTIDLDRLDDDYYFEHEKYTGDQEHIFLDNHRKP